MKAWKVTLSVLSFVSLASIIFMGYFCFDNKCALTGPVTPAFKSDFDAYLAGSNNKHTFEDRHIDKDYHLNLEEEDVIVFLHIQKTGGSIFGKHLVDLDTDPPCVCFKRRDSPTGKRHCDCVTRKRTIWLFNRLSTGWPCGVHADWTELKACMNKIMDKKEHMKRKRRYYYVTMLRDPVKRYISEYMHVRRGATWKTAHLMCNGREATLEEVPICYDTVNWENVSLDEFLECPYNLAHDRQTRMLANLSVVNCYNTTGMDKKVRDNKMFESAKQNLLDMAFIGLTEFQKDTQFLFEHTFKLKFLSDFIQYNSTSSNRADINDVQRGKIIERNTLDILLYQFAKDLFLQRVKKAREEVAALGPPSIVTADDANDLNDDNQIDEFQDERNTDDKEHFSLEKIQRRKIGKRKRRRNSAKRNRLRKGDTFKF